MSSLGGALRGAGRMAAWGARGALPVGQSLGLAAVQFGTAGIAAGVHFGAVAGATALGVGVAGYGAAKFLGGGKIFTSKDGLPRLRGGIQAAMVAGTLGVSAGLGARQALQQRKGGWGVSTAPNAPLEMERSDFMGATGSLTLNSRAPKSFAGAAADSLNIAWSRTGALYADDAAHLLLAALHR